MTTLSSISAVSAAATSQAASASGYASLGQGDFLRLLTEQLKQQDPLDPVDNKDMLAQMAQFSALAGTTEGNATLQSISAKLDTLIAVQSAEKPAGQAPVAS